MMQVHMQFFKSAAVHGQVSAGLQGGQPGLPRVAAGGARGLSEPQCPTAWAHSVLTDVAHTLPPDGLCSNVSLAQVPSTLMY